MLIGNKEFKITPADFDTAMDLQEAVGDAIVKSKITAGIDSIMGSQEEKDFSLLNMNFSGETIGELVKALIQVGISKKLRECVFKCMEGRSLLGDDKLDKAFFEVEKNREYFYQIAFEIIKANILPFFKSLFSQLPENVKQKITSFQK